MMQPVKALALRGGDVVHRLCASALAAVGFAALVLSCPTPFGYYSAGNSLVSAIEGATSTAATPAATPLFLASPVSGGNAVIVSGTPSEDRDQYLSFRCDTEGALIYYTIDGSTPDPNRPATHLYNPAQPIKVLGNDTVMTVNALAFKALLLPSAMATVTITISYTQASSPGFSLAGGTYGSAQTVVITDSTPGAMISYTTDGSPPVIGGGATTSAPAPATFTVDRTMTIRAIASATGYSSSNEASVSYALQSAAPTFSLLGGTYNSPQSVTISAVTSGSVVWYTTNGSPPEAGGSLGGTSQATFAVDATMTVKAVTSIAGWTPSMEASRAYTLQPSSPSYSFAGGNFNQAQSVTLSAVTPGSVVWYTTDGSEPHVSTSPGGSDVVTVPITVSTTLRSIASQTGWTNSPTASQTYTLVCLPPTMPGSATMLGIESITVNAQTGSDVVWYTTNGTPPSAGAPSLGGTSPSAGVPIRRTATVRAIAARTGWENSSEVSATYTTGLQLYYSFDDAGSGTAIDGSGNGWNGTVANATAVTGHNGAANSAYSFNGTNAKVERPVGTGTIFSSTPNVSFSAWVYISSGVSGLHYFIMAGGIGVLEDTGPVFDLAISTPTTDSGSGIETYIGAWHHLAGTFDGTTISFYLDGQLVTYVHTPAPASASAATGISVGCFGTTYWPGTVDELRIYNRTLTPTEIATLHNTP